MRSARRLEKRSRNQRQLISHQIPQFEPSTSENIINDARPSNRKEEKTSESKECQTTSTERRLIDFVREHRAGGLLLALAVRICDLLSEVDEAQQLLDRKNETIDLKRELLSLLKGAKVVPADSTVNGTNSTPSNEMLVGESDVDISSSSEDFARNNSEVESAVVTADTESESLESDYLGNLSYDSDYEKNHHAKTNIGHGSGTSEATSSPRNGSDVHETKTMAQENKPDNQLEPKNSTFVSTSIPTAPPPPPADLYTNSKKMIVFGADTSCLSMPQVSSPMPLSVENPTTSPVPLATVLKQSVKINGHNHATFSCQPSTTMPLGRKSTRTPPPYRARPPILPASDQPPEFLSARMRLRPTKNAAVEADIQRDLERQRNLSRTATLSEEKNYHESFP